MVLYKRGWEAILQYYLLCMCVSTDINASLLIYLNTSYFNWVEVQNYFNGLFTLSGTGTGMVQVTELTQ